MSNKKLIIIFIVVVIVIIILFNVILKMLQGRSILPRNTNKYIYNSTEYEKKIEEVESGKITGKYESTKKDEQYYNLNQEERNELDKKIDDTLDLINSKNIDKIYSLFEEDYIYFRFPSKEDLASYLDEELKDDNKLVAKSFELHKNRLKIQVEPESGDSDIKTIMLSTEEVSGEKVDTLFLGNVVGYNYLTGLYVNKNCRLEVCNMLDYSNSYAIIMRIVNKTDKELEIKFDDTKLVSTDGLHFSKKNLKSKKETIVPASSSKYIEMCFSKTALFPQYIELNCTINGEAISERYTLFNADIDIE